MPISATCRRAEPSRPSGFTLVELLVVLVIMGLAIGLVWPRLDNWYEQTSYRRTLDDVALRIDALNGTARRLALPIRIEATGVTVEPQPEEPVLALPDGWRVVSAEGVLFHPSGACTGGALRIVDPAGRARDFELRAPHCRVTQ